MVSLRKQLLVATALVASLSASVSPVSSMQAAPVQPHQSGYGLKVGLVGLGLGVAGLMYTQWDTIKGCYYRYAIQRKLAQVRAKIDASSANLRDYQSQTDTPLINKGVVCCSNSLKTMSKVVKDWQMIVSQLSNEEILSIVDSMTALNDYYMKAVGVINSVASANLRSMLTNALFNYPVLPAGITRLKTIYARFVPTRDMTLDGIFAALRQFGQTFVGMTSSEQRNVIATGAAMLLNAGKQVYREIVNNLNRGALNAPETGTASTVAIEDVTDSHVAQPVARPVLRLTSNQHRNEMPD